MPKNRKNLTLNSPVASVLSQPRVANYPERGARLARREERAYREYVSDEQRSQAGCPARRIVKYWLGQDTSLFEPREDSQVSQPTELPTKLPNREPSIEAKFA